MNPLEQQVREAVADIPGISVLLVFGSRARGDERPGSDLDVAVLPELDPQAEPEDAALLRHRLQKRLAIALSGLAPPRGGSRVDVVFLDRAPDTVRQRVMEQGRMILCRDEEAWKALRIKTMREYGDREWFRRIYRRELRRRLLDGRPSERSARTRKPLERARKAATE